MKQKVTVFGSAVVDLMARTPHLPAPGETVRGSVFRQSSGGKGLNQAVAAGKAGGDVTMVMKLGRDSLAEVPLAAMREAGLPTDYVFYHDTASTVIDPITAALVAGDKVQLVGFGTFETKQREARTGRNPRSGETIEIPAASLPAFKAGKALKDAVAK